MFRKLRLWFCIVFVFSVAAGPALAKSKTRSPASISLLENLSELFPGRKKDKTAKVCSVILKLQSGKGDQGTGPQKILLSFNGRKKLPVRYQFSKKNQASPKAHIELQDKETLVFRDSKNKWRFSLGERFKTKLVLKGQNNHIRVSTLCLPYETINEVDSSQFGAQKKAHIAHLKTLTQGR